MIRIEEFPRNGNPWRIDGLGRIHYPSSTRSEPTIATHLSELQPDYFDPLANASLTGNGTTAHIKIGQIALLKQGSVWVDGIRALPRMEPYWHEFSFDPAQMSLHRFDESISIAGQSIVPLTSQRYKVSYESWKGLADSWHGVVETEDARAAFFIFPSAVLFQKCVATSPAAVRRVAWGELNRVVDNPGWVVDEPGTFYVELFKNIRDAEAPALANLCADPAGRREYSRFRHALVANSVNAVAGSGRRFSTHVRFGLPFSNRVEVRVQGKHLRVEGGGGKTTWGFLVTEIISLRTKLIFDRLVVHRKNDGRRGENTGDEDLEDAWIAPDQVSVGLESHDEVPVNSGDDPLAGLAAVNVEETGGFEAIDLELLKDPKDTQQYAGRRRGGETPDFDGSTTTGDVRSDVEGAAELDIEAHEAPRVPVTLDDFFETLRMLRQSNLPIVTIAVADKHRFTDDGDVVNFFPLKMEGMRSWNRVSSMPGSSARAFVVAECHTGGVWHHFLELERKGSEAHALAYVRVIDGSQISPAAIRAFIHQVALNNGWDEGAIQPQWIFRRINHSPKHGNARFAAALAAVLGGRLSAPADQSAIIDETMPVRADAPPLETTSEPRALSRSETKL